MTHYSIHGMISCCVTIFILSILGVIETDQVSATYSDQYDIGKSVNDRNSPIEGILYSPLNIHNNIVPGYLTYISFADGGSYTIGSVTSVANEDILSLDGENNFAMVFDGSDVGVVPSISAFHIVDEDTILFSLRAGATFGGLTVDDSDIVQFDATSLGTNTAGTFSLFFDGSDVSLTTNDEDIDALAILPDGRLLISTTGNPVVSGVSSGRDEDILVFDPTSLGPNTSGAWSLYLDSSDVGLSVSDEDIDSLAVADTGELFFSTVGSFNVSGISGADEDIFSCNPTSLGNSSTCSFASTLALDGSSFGFAGLDIDAFSLGEDPRDPPIASFASSTPDFLGSSTLFTNTSTGPDLSYSWNFGDGSPSKTATDPTYTYLNPGTYTVVLTATNDDGVDSFSQIVEITLPETIDGLTLFNDSPTTLGSVTNFDATVTSGENVQYVWNFGDDSPEIEAGAVSHTYGAVGEYTVVATATNAVSSAVATTAVTVLDEPPVANFSHNSPVRLDNAINFINDSSGTNLSYEWAFGDGALSLNQNPTHTYATTGTYTVILTVENSVGTDQYSEAIIVADPVEEITGLTASNDSPTEVGNPTTLSATISSGTEESYLWSFGDGQNGVGAVISHAYNQAGQYTATVLASNEAGVAIAETIVTMVDIPPVANFTSNSPKLLGQPIIFTTNSNGTNLSYAWNFGDGSISNAEDPSHNYNAAGFYTVVMTASNSSGINTTSQIIVVQAPPSDPELYLTFGLGGSYTLGSVNGVQNEDIVKYDGTDFEMVFDGSDVGVTPSINAFKVLDEDTILFSLRSAATLGGLSVSDADIVQFEANSLGTSTSGSFSLYFDGSDVGLTTSNEDIDGIEVLEDGRLLISTAGNPSVSGVSSVNDEDILVFTPNSLGGSTSGTWAMYFDASDVSLSNSGEGITGIAQTDDGDLYLSTIGSFAVSGVSGADEDVFKCDLISQGTSTACNFTSSLVFDGHSFGLSDNEIDGLDYWAGGLSELLPVAGFTTSSPDEVGEVTSFTNTTVGSNLIYAWSFGDGAISNAVNPSHSYASPGSYTVIMTAIGISGSDTTSEIVTITAPPEPIVGVIVTNDGPTELGQSTLLNADIVSGNQASYLWSFGDGQNGTGAVTTHSYPQTGVYTATVLASNDISSDIGTTTVTVVDAPPVAIFSSSSPDELGQVTSFTNSSLGTNLTYEWNFGDGAISTDENPSHTYAAIDNYTVMMTATNSVGSAIGTEQVIIEAVPPATPELYLSFNDGNSYTLGSVTGVQNEDIVKFDGTDFEMFFDGSDVDVAASIDAFKILDEDTILFSLRSGETLNGLSVTDADIVQFDATSLGRITEGTFSLYFDASDVELTTSSEDIDGFDVLEDGRLLISTTSNPSVSGVSSPRDEDILVFTPSSLGSTTSGSWDIYFDGSDVLLSSSDENVTGLALTTAGDLLLSTVGNFSVSGLSGADEDVFSCGLTNEGTNTACDYDTSLFFDGSAFGLSDYEISGLDYSQAGNTDPPPIAGFTSSSPDDIGEVTSFVNTTTGSSVSYEWDFGDGTTSTAVNPTRLYATDGSYTVVLTATNAQGSDTFSDVVTILAVPESIVGLDASNDGPTELGQSTLLSASVTSGTNISYTWDFGDGQAGSGANVSHTYDVVGTYTATVTASNTENSEIASTIINVVDTPPVAIFFSSSPDELGQATSFTNNSLGTNLNYTWSFGDGTTSTEITPIHTYVTTGTFTVVMTATNSIGSAISTNEVVIVALPPPDPDLYVTFGSGGSYALGSVTGIQNEDIVRYDGVDFEMLFDGSDVGVTPSINAFNILDENTILFSVRSATTLGGLSVTDADIVQFEASSLGQTTQGTFSLYFDGSDVGLTTSDEDIDAIDVLSDGRLLISTIGNPTVTGVSSPRDEDILVFTPSRLGTSTAGSWALYFDASDVGLSNSGEGIAGVAQTDDDYLYLSTADSFSVSGLSGADEDVFKCKLISEGTSSACDYASPLVFDGDSFGLSANEIDGLDYIGLGLTEEVPEAQFVSTSPDGAGEGTSFTNLSVGHNLSYLWDFGDGSTSTDKDPIHIYPTPGTYTVLLTTSNIYGSSTVSEQVIIVDPNQVTEREHPYLLFNLAELVEVRAAVQQNGDPRQDMLAALEDGYLSGYDSDPTDGDDMFLNAVAYAVTEETKYFTRARADLLDFVNNESCWDVSVNNACLRDRVAGINMIKVSLTYDILYQSLSDSDRQTVRERLFLEACKQYEAATWGGTNGSWSNWWSTTYTNNHYTSSIAGLGIAALALQPEEALLGTCESSNFAGANFSTTVDDWIDYTTNSFNTAKIVWDQIEDGHWPEGDIYHVTLFSDLGRTLYILDRLQGTSFTDTPIMKKFPQYYLYDSMPNQRWNNILNAGDAFSARRESFRFLRDLRMLANVHDDEVAQWLADEIIVDLGGRPKNGGDLFVRVFEEFAHELFYYDPMVAATSPSQMAFHRTYQATDGEEVFMWSGWNDDNALIAALHSSPPGGDSGFDIAKSNYDGREWEGDGVAPQDLRPATAHAHADSNGFYLYGNGTYLIPEIAATRDNDIKWASSTTAHNTITVGGKDQIGGCLNNSACTGDEEYVPYGVADAYYGKDEYWNQGDVEIATFATAENYDFTVGDATDAYANAEGVEEFTRNIMFVEKSYVVMMDDIRLTSSQQVDWYMHTQDGASLEGDWVKGLANNDNVIGIKVLSPASFSFNVAPVDIDNDQKFELQYLDPDRELFRVRLQQTQATPRFITVFYPSTTSTWSARPTVNLLSETNDGASVEVVHQSGEREVTVVNYGETSSVNLGSYTLDGKAASVSFDNAGQVDGYFLAEGTRLKDSGLNTSAASEYDDVLVTQLPAGATFEANFAGTDLTVSGSNVTQFVAYAPVTVQRLYLQTINADNKVNIVELAPTSYSQVGDYIYYNVALPIDPPTAEFSTNSPVYLGQTINFTSQSTGQDLSYSWNFGDGSPLVSTVNPTHTYSATGTYTVTLTASNSVGSDSFTTQITIDNVPDEPIVGLSLESSSPTELGQTTALSVTVSGGTNIKYDWNMGDGTVMLDSGATMSHTYAVTGTYTVMLTATNGVGSEVITTMVDVIVLPPMASFSNSSPDQLNEITSFTNTSTGTNLTYSWTFGDGETSSVQNPTHTYNLTGTYTVVLTVTNSIGQDMTSSQVVIE